MHLNFCFCFFTWYSYWSSAVRLKVCEITAGIKKYDPIKEKKVEKNMIK